MNGAGQDILAGSAFAHEQDAGFGIRRRQGLAAHLASMRAVADHAIQRQPRLCADQPIDQLAHLLDAAEHGDEGGWLSLRVADSAQADQALSLGAVDSEARFHVIQFFASR